MVWITDETLSKICDSQPRQYWACEEPMGLSPQCTNSLLTFPLWILRRRNDPNFQQVQDTARAQRAQRLVGVQVSELQADLWAHLWVWWADMRKKSLNQEFRCQSLLCALVHLPRCTGQQESLSGPELTQLKSNKKLAPLNHHLFAIKGKIKQSWFESKLHLLAV